MSHLLDIVALAIVLLCVMYAAHALLPHSVLARITGNAANAKKSGACGGCDGGCDTSKKHQQENHRQRLPKRKQDVMR